MINGSKKLLDVTEMVGKAHGVPAEKIRLFQAINAMGNITIREYFGASAVVWL